MALVLLGVASFFTWSPILIGFVLKQIGLWDCVSLWTTGLMAELYVLLFGSLAVVFIIFPILLLIGVC